MTEPTARREAGAQEGDLRARLIGAFHRVRSQTAGLAADLTDEDQLVQSAPQTNPTKWHLAHTTWFFETVVLARHAPGYTAFDERFGDLFDPGFGHGGAYHPPIHYGLLSRPAIHEVERYRDTVNAALVRLIRQLPDTALAEVAGAIESGIAHEEQHQELILSDIKHAFWSNPLLPAYQPDMPPAPTVPGPHPWFAHPGGMVEIGAAGGDGFHFDHEGPRHSVFLRPFRLAGRPVSNAEFLAFIGDGGYDDPGPWLADGWAAVQAEGWRAPLYWLKRDGAWHIFTLSGLRPLNPAEPVCHVSFYEADAFARWAGKRLPIEAEWEMMAGNDSGMGNTLDSGMLHPTVSCCASDGPWQMCGDVWEWTASPFMPYPGYRAPMGGSSGKFMSNRMVLRGGSCVTPGDFLRPTVRHFLGLDARWQFTGFRLAEDA